MTWILVSGENARLVDQLREPIRRALANRRSFYRVSVDNVGRAGEVLVSITGSHGHVPLCLAASELEPAHFSEVVRDTVSRLGL
jgi:hypothetical protein